MINENSKKVTFKKKINLKRKMKHSFISINLAFCCIICSCVSTTYAGDKSSPVKPIPKPTPKEITKEEALRQYSIGIEAINKGDDKIGAAALEKYISYMKNNIPEKESEEAKQFEKAVGYLIYAYKKLGKLKEVERTMKYIGWINGPEDEDAPDKMADILTAAQVKLDASEILKKEGKPGWKKAVESTIEPLKKLQWGSTNVYFGLAAIELSKAYVLLGRYDEADKQLKNYWDLINSFDEGYREWGLVPPSAKAHLWKGYMNLERGEKAEKKDERIKYLYKAANDFVYVVAKYDQKKCQFTGKAAQGFNKVKKLLEKEGKIPIIPQNIMPPVLPDRSKADKLFIQEKYEEAIPLYVEILQTEGARSSDDAPDLMSRTVYAYLKTGKILEAISLVTYLAEYFPEDKGTPLALLQVGETLWKEYKKSPKTKKGRKARDEAFRVYKIYLKHFPKHKYADGISARMAQDRFMDAINILKEADKLTGEERAEKAKEARQVFKEVIPAYQRIEKNYPHTDLGKRSLVNLAECYKCLKQYTKAAETFKKYADICNKDGNKEEAVTWYRKAAELGNQPAKYFLEKSGL